MNSSHCYGWHGDEVKISDFETLFCILRNKAVVDYKFFLSDTRVIPHLNDCKY